MPIYALDTETSGLNAKAFLLGCVMGEDERPHIFSRKEEMWQYLKNEAKKEEKRGHNVFAYSHNHEFDFYAYGDLKDKRMEYRCSRPFIAVRDNLWLLDTVAITRAPLSEVAKWVGLEKGETPAELKEGMLTYDEFHEDFMLRSRTAHYCANDTLIVMRTVKAIKAKLEGEGLHIKRLISAGQIGASIFLNQVNKTTLSDHWIDQETHGFHQTTAESNELIGRACRGARVQAFKTGKFENCSYFDVNSLYPHILSTMTLPDLARGERKATLESLRTDAVGVTRAIIRKPKGMIGVPVRVPAKPRFELAFPKQEATICGTYTLQELRAFQDAGCKITEVRGIEYPALENPLRKFIQEKYDLRLNSAFEKAFWKLVLNNIVGKFAQKRESVEMRFAELGDEGEMKRKGFTLKDIADNLGVYESKGKAYRSRVYCPILFASVTAGARLTLWEKIQRMDEEDLCYCDTDSILCTNGEKYKDTLFKMGTNLGEWKLEGTDTLTVWGKKTYSFGGKLKAAGASKREVSEEMARTGTLTYKKMMGMRANTEMAGTFHEENRKLADTLKKHEEYEKRIAKQTLFIDKQEPAMSKKEIRTLTR